jgi:hypothetical protein
MLFLLSPAKSLDYETPVPAAIRRRLTEPALSDAAAELIGILRKKTPAEVAGLMDLSDALAALNVGRYAAWQREATALNSKAAVLAFDGDVYGGLDARSLAAADLDWAQRHLVILSGLYGILRPLDRLQPYRLEMGTALATPAGRNLYDYWGDRLAALVDEHAAQQRRPLIVNLASQEYARAVLRPALRTPVLHCRFEECRPGQAPKVISFFAKRARGLMARFAIRQRARDPRVLQTFNDEGYAFDTGASRPDEWVFRRTIATQEAP